MTTVKLLIVLFLITFILTLCEDIFESKKGENCMKKFIHTKLNAKMLTKAITKNVLVICRSTAASALSANTL